MLTSSINSRFDSCTEILRLLYISNPPSVLLLGHTEIFSMDVDNFTGNKPFPKNLKCGVLGATGYVRGRNMTTSIYTGFTTGKKRRRCRKAEKD